MITQKNIEENLKLLIKSKDYSVTGEEFSLYKNEVLDLLITKPTPNSLGKYYESEKYISHTDSKKSLIDKVYQFVRNYTLQKKLRLINSLKTENKNLLDIGCGTGDFLNICQQNNWNVTGIEPNQKAREISLTKNLVIKEDLENISNEKFDVITLWHVLEHVPNLIEYIKTIKTLLSEDGVLIIAVPNYKSYDANYYKQFWAAYDLPRHLWHFSRKSISTIFSSQNMNVEKTFPMKFDSFYVSLLSEKYKKNKIGLVNAFFIGLLSNIKAFKTKEFSSLIYLIKNK